MAYTGDYGVVLPNTMPTPGQALMSVIENKQKNNILEEQRLQRDQEKKREDYWKSVNYLDRQLDNKDFVSGISVLDNIKRKQISDFKEKTLQDIGKIPETELIYRINKFANNTKQATELGKNILAENEAKLKEFAKDHPNFNLAKGLQDLTKGITFNLMKDDLSDIKQADHINVNQDYLAPILDPKQAYKYINNPNDFIESISKDKLVPFFAKETNANKGSTEYKGFTNSFTRIEGVDENGQVIKGQKPRKVYNFGTPYKLGFGLDGKPLNVDAVSDKMLEAVESDYSRNGGFDFLFREGIDNFKKGLRNEINAKEFDKLTEVDFRKMFLADQIKTHDKSGGLSPNITANPVINIRTGSGNSSSSDKNDYNSIQRAQEAAMGNVKLNVKGIGEAYEMNTIPSDISAKLVGTVVEKDDKGDPKTVRKPFDVFLTTPNGKIYGGFFELENGKVKLNSKGSKVFKEGSLKEIPVESISGFYAKANATMKNRNNAAKQEEDNVKSKGKGKNKTYSASEEQGIAAVMKGNKVSREAAIQALVAAGRLK